MNREIKKKDIAFAVTGSQEFWNSFEDQSWEPDTMNILDKFLQATDVMVDIGAWIGPISLYSSSKIKKCYSFEPDPIAYGELSQNLALNPQLKEKVSLFNMAITTNGEKVKIFSRYSYGDSGTSLLKRVKSKNDYVEVSSITFERFLADHKVEKVDFIKMNIEGAEFFIVPTMLPYLQAHRPAFLISLHHPALTEFLELSIFPYGFLRRIYRLLDPKKTFLRNKSTKQMKGLLKALGFYAHCVNGKLEPFDHQNATTEDLEKLDMLLFY